MAWALRYNGGQKSAIDTDIAVTANLTIEIDFKINTLGVNQIILGNEYGFGNLSNNTMQIGLQNDNKLAARFGGSGNAKSAALTTGTLYKAKLVVTGLDTVTDGTAQGTAELFLDDVSQGTFTPWNNPLTSAFTDQKPSKLGAGGKVADTKDPFNGDIFRVRMTGDSFDYHWQPNSSDRSNTGLPPVITDTIAGNNFTGVVTTVPFATDGTAWVEDVTVGDSDPPNYTVAPAITATTSDGHTISATLDETGTVYAVRLDNGAAAPTSAQVKAGTDAADVALSADDKKTSAATAATNVDLVFTGGGPSTAYDYYYTAEDDEGTPNLRASPTLVEGTTSATTQAITITGGDLEAGNTEAGTYTNMTGVAATGTVTDSQGNQFSVTVTDGNDNTMTVAVPALPSSGTSSLGLFGNVTLQIDEAP
jgi:hypothetical protein